MLDHNYIRTALLYPHKPPLLCVLEYGRPALVVTGVNYHRGLSEKNIMCAFCTRS